MGKKARKKAAAAMARRKKKAAFRSTSTASAGGTARRPSRKKKNRKAASPGNSTVAAALAGAMVALNMSNVAYGQKVVDLHALERKDVKEIVIPEEGKDVQTVEEKVSGTGLGDVLEKKEKTTTSTAMLEESPPQVPDMSGKRDDDGSLSPALVKVPKGKDTDTTVEDDRVMAPFSPYAATHIKRHDDGTVSYRLRGRLLSKASKVPKGQCTNRSLFCQPSTGSSPACENTNITSGNKVFGCGSCDGDDACNNLFEYSFEVGEYSCRGSSACEQAYNSIIGDFACLGEYACEYARNIMIDDYACQGDSACARGDNIVVGKESCLGRSACVSAGGSEIEDGSCVGENAPCLYSDYAKISKASCIGNFSCSRMDRLTVKGESCRGAFACSQEYEYNIDDYDFYVEIGDESCNCRGCCKNLEPDCKIPKGKCNSMDYDCSFNSSRGCPMF